MVWAEASSALRADLDASQEEYDKPNVAFCVTNSGRVCCCVQVSHVLCTFGEMLVRRWHASVPKVKKYSSFERMHEPAFAFVCLRPGETELSNKNKSQINYGPEQGARRFVLTLYALQTPLFFLPRFQCFDSACLFGRMTWILARCKPSSLDLMVGWGYLLVEINRRKLGRPWRTDVVLHCASAEPQGRCVSD